MKSGQEGVGQFLPILCGHHLWTIPYRAGRVAVTVATGPEEVYDTP